MQGRPKCNARQLTRGREKEGYGTSSGTLNSERNMAPGQGNHVFQKMAADRSGFHSMLGPCARD